MTRIGELSKKDLALDEVEQVTMKESMPRLILFEIKMMVAPSVIILSFLCCLGPLKLTHLPSSEMQVSHTSMVSCFLIF